VAAEFVERRRTPRVAVDGRHQWLLPRRLRARVVDISAVGALLATDEQMPMETRGKLQVPLGGGPFEAQIEVRREHAVPAGGHVSGAVVTPAHPRHQEVLEAFLRRAGE
jgi:hypothetical protein